MNIYVDENACGLLRRRAHFGKSRERASAKVSESENRELQNSVGIIL